MALVVADAGPVIAFAKIGQLGILKQLFAEITLPDAVWQESQAKRGGDAALIAQAVMDGWIKVVTVHRSQRFPLSLHDGEIEALELACQQKGTLLVLDDQLARREAVKLQLDFIGTVRVLALAEEKGFINSAIESIELMQGFGYRISAKFL